MQGAGPGWQEGGAPGAAGGRGSTGGGGEKGAHQPGAAERRGRTRGGWGKRGAARSGPFCRTKQKRKVLSRLFLCGRRHRVSQETGPGTCTRLGKTADPPGDDHAGLGSCPACSLSPSPVSAGRRSHPFLQGRLPPYRRWTSALPHLLHPTPPTPSAVHHRERLARRPGQGPLWSFPTSAAPAGFQSHSRKAPAASTGGHTCPGSSELPSAPGERQL